MLRDLQSKRIHFVWGGGCPRVSRKILFTPKDKGDLGLPHIVNYYRAEQLCIVGQWSQRESSKHWYHMDRAVAVRSYLAPTQGSTA